MDKNIKIGFVSLGCPKNQIDTEIMLHELMTVGYEITGEDIEADIIIINTCAFIESAKKEAIDNILDVAWLKKNSNLKGIIVTGCLPERYRDEVMAELPEVDAVLGVGSIHDVVEAVENVASKQKFTSFKPVSELVLGGNRALTTPEFSVYLKIAEGCDNRCSYCAIPSIRGGYRQRRFDDIVSEAQTLSDLGAKEIILVAQDTTNFDRLPELILTITLKTNIEWLRLLYCYPDKITDKLIFEIKNNPKVVKYIDMPIQHISDKILKSMNRHGGSDVIKSAIKRLREADICIRTTAIVGFPGETEEDFAELCEFIKETRFDRFGAFTYSQEEGTLAAGFENQIDEQTKQDRYDTLMEIQLQIAIELNEAKIGTVQKVLCEGFDVVSEMFYGRSYADAPDIDGKIYFGGKVPQPIQGTFYNVKITEVLDYDLIGEVIT
ncbi:MAG: 30S ribosomal protein S12 methylthiotransferase RimO [Oscillospiraceae bacterium]|nr:30S ribosomal protein S12 methylthiotransferase RimO [Oscillospiraceae bacterium]